VEHAAESAVDVAVRSAEVAQTPALPARRSSLARQFGWFGAGTALALLVVLMRDMQADPAPPGPVAVWTADRDAQRVFGLDASLLVAHRIAVDWPLEVEATRDGGLWVLRSDDGRAGSSSRLDRFDAQGALVAELFLEPCSDLAAIEGEDALVLEHVNNSVRLSRVRSEGSLFPLLDRPDLLCVAGSRASALVGTSTGSVLRVDPHSGAILSQVQLDGTIGDVAAGPSSGSAWALDTQGRLFLLDETLAIRWAAGIPFPCAHIGAVPDEERVWIADTTAPRIRRLGPGGVVELDRQDLPVSALDRTLAWTGGGALLLTPGAILHVDEHGALVPGQGGFAWLSDAARVR
jgi:hypothetical protein